MNMPDINKCFGMFPPKYACFLISIFGLGTGGIGLAGIVLYGLAEDSVVAHFIKSQDTDPMLKKVCLMTIGLSSLLLLVANTLLFLGSTTASGGSVTAAKWVLFVMCLLLLLGAIGAPVSCFFLPKTCIIKKISAINMVLGYLAVAIFVQIWLYFMVVAYNYEMQL